MMVTEDVVIQNFENLLSNNGMTLSELINVLGRRNSPVLNLSDEKQREFCDLYDQIDGEKFDKSEKGKRLEQLASILFGEDSIEAKVVSFK